MSELQDDATIVQANIIQANYEAQKWNAWFYTDSQNVQNFCSTIFRGGVDAADPQFLMLLQAANVAIFEIEDDIVKLKEFLATYVPLDKNLI